MATLREISGLADPIYAKRPHRLPVVLARHEVRAVLDEVRGVPRLMGARLYGAGLRRLECAQLRVKDIDPAPQPDHRPRGQR